MRLIVIQFIIVLWGLYPYILERYKAYSINRHWRSLALKEHLLQILEK